MKIELHKIKIADLVAGYVNNNEEGVVGYGGRLNIRPPYQREFIYETKQKQAVIDSIFRGYPLNVMYWVKNDEGTYELLDGQQRTMSICSYWAGDYFVTIDGNLKAFGNLTPDERERFLGYELMVYVCTDGTDSDRIAWFRIINIAGKKLTDQEILNAIYCGPWVTDAKRHFSKTGCVACKLGSDYLKGELNRQDYLAATLAWISRGHVEAYMAEHQHDETADREWQYFQTVIAWVKTLFPHYRKEMKGVAWGTLYNDYHNREYSATELERRVKVLMMDDDVTAKSGIYPYLITGDERWLSLRAFTIAMRRAAYERQQGICAHCHKHFEFGEMEADHIKPWREGGRTVSENCQMLCRHCNRVKGGKWPQEHSPERQAPHTWVRATRVCGACRCKAGE